MNSVRILSIFAALGFVGTASAAWTRLPWGDSDKPMDVASVSIPGTKIAASSGVGDAAAFISESVTEAATIGVGKSSLVITLSSQMAVDCAAFVNDSSAGKVTYSGSRDNKEWTVLGSVVFAPTDRVIPIHFASMSLKYLKINFDVSIGGALRTFKLFGAMTDNDAKLKPAGGDGGSSVNLAAAGAARAIYAFPTPTNIGELGFKNNVWKFPKTSDKYRTIVYDLGSLRTVKQFATSYSQRPTRVEVFAFEQLPEKKDWRGKLTLDPAVFSTIPPTAAGEDPRGIGHIRIIPSKPVRAQYIAVRFEPNYQRNATGALFDATWGQFAFAFLGPVGALVDAVDLLPQSEMTVDAGGDFIVGGVELLSSDPFQQVLDIINTESQKGQPGSSGTGTGAGSGDFNAPPYYPVAPGSPPAAGTGGLGTPPSLPGTIANTAAKTGQLKKLTHVGPTSP